ncbi:metallophosphoesterase family protein [Piscibacillus salipiscarius]|uniref:metallophosphoesterase family protein n=1 Tax=Piscibacillus salipiscarius TaxID=299480 RepID=UPI0006D1C1AD
MMQEKAKLIFPQNTYIFPSDGVNSTTYHKHGQPLAEISGFSYRKQAIKENMVASYQRVTDASYHIATLHGSLKTDQIHDHYAPFLIEDLKKIETDYWALGHIHQREIISHEPLAIYPGNIQGRHMKERGEKGCYIVELNGSKPTYQFYPLQNIVFSEEEVAVEDIQKPSELVEFLLKFKDSLRKRHSKMMVRLILNIRENDFSEDRVEDLLDTLNESEEDEENWIWFSELKLRQEQISWDEIIESNPFIKEVLKTIEETDDLSSFLLDLKRHPLYRKC